MADVTVRLTGTLKAAGFERARRFLAAPFAGATGKLAIEALRASVAGEFRSGAWSKPEGGRASWKAVNAFGKRPATVPPLGGLSGPLARAWAGGTARGVSGFEQQSDLRALIGVRSSRPWPIRHRGGDDESVSLSSTEQTVTRKMAYYLGKTFGVWLKEGRSISLPSRPHATRNPALEKALVRILTAAIKREAAS